MSTKHIPGPWKAIGGEVHLVDSCGVTRPVIVARTGSGDLGRANACLVAAAPDLLEAAKAMVAGGYVMDFDSPEWVALEAAIARAEEEV